MINTFPANLLTDLEVPVPQKEADDFLPTLTYILRCICTPRDSRAFLMRYKDGKTFDEIGEALGLTRQRTSYMVQDILCRFTKEHREMLFKGLKQYYDELLLERIKAISSTLDESEREEIKLDAYEKGYSKGYADGSAGFKQSKENVTALDDITLDLLGLSTWTYNSLSKNGVKTLGDVMSLGDKLINARTFGKTCFREIAKILADYGVNVQRSFPACVKKWG